ncbi:MAG: Rrf2 family transcriptional regulator [Oscillospiraceae bacterium]|nr:Rrf2 family transcriptional regulator [Oscillospiraceae bacterium]
MMVSTKGRYALRVMIDLAEHSSSTYIPSKEIAGRQDISEKYLESILTALTKAGLLQGMRGKGGGYRLSKPVEQYNVGEILRAVEDTLAPVSCLEKGATCARSAECRTLQVWVGLENVVNQYLDGVSLTDLTSAGAAGDDYVI